MTGSRKRVCRFVLATAAAIIGLAFLVPEYADTADTSWERALSISTNGSGERLLFRTMQHDYEFTLPANRINEALASEAQAYYRSTYLEDLRVAPSGTVRASAQMNFGGYDAGLSETKTILPEKERTLLQSFGFLPSDGNVVGNFNPSLYMTWRASLVGQMYPPGSRSLDDGGATIDLMPRDILVTADDPTTLQRNRRLRATLSPLIDLKNAVLDIAKYPILLLMLIFVGNPFPSG